MRASDAVVANSIHAMHNACESHQNEAGRSHRPVAFYLIKLQEYRSDKNSF